MSTKVIYSCQACGNNSPRWTGRCTACGAWDSIVEELAPKNKCIPRIQKEPPRVLPLCGETTESAHRLCIGNDEFDRTLGGGIVAGSSTLIGGEPGIGKSTLMLQVFAALARQSCSCLYVSGEESIAQIRARASRLKISEPLIQLVATQSLSTVLSAACSDNFGFLVVDSIQTIHDEEIPSSPGTILQVRMCAHKLITLAKQRDIGLFMLGQITKDGAIAGPKTLEHLVDTVLYFEGSNGDKLRILRTVKNRFGPANEMGVFEMSTLGLLPVQDPSMLFLGQSPRKGITGNVVFAGIEGSRPILVEVQSLIASTYAPSPRRAVVGWDINRLAMVVAVLNARCNMPLTDKEIYLSIAGGLKICEPASDLAIAASLMSSITKSPTPSSTVIFGEVALSGEIRSVTNVSLRLREACKLGFKRAIAPQGSKEGGCNFPIEIQEIAHIGELSRLLS
ncbi:DNA repair protein RadA [Anaplasma capra]|uniref:DNA repair protein RadA n=1 Tax=Anaplasma capra TaxID=1562740 RepID=UPI0021D5F42E|nr:DNA repair protein RadA [Anaplasma capra]MCU7611722.1 DNA repair protein RadA [Anaplasma capra]MCU7612527.1 DNA repair protein RadA [Anaplasma capra]